MLKMPFHSQLIYFLIKPS